MEHKLSQFKPKTRKLSPDEAIKKLNEIEALYTEVLGPREDWDEFLMDCFRKIRMAALCRQYPAEEDLERQYESRNSIDM